MPVYLLHAAKWKAEPLEPILNTTATLQDAESCQYQCNGLSRASKRRPPRLFLGGIDRYPLRHVGAGIVQIARPRAGGLHNAEAGRDGADGGVLGDQVVRAELLAVGLPELSVVQACA